MRIILKIERVTLPYGIHSIKKVVLTGTPERISNLLEVPVTSDIKDIITTFGRKIDDDGLCCEVRTCERFSKKSIEGFDFDKKISGPDYVKKEIYYKRDDLS